MKCHEKRRFLTRKDAHRFHKENRKVHTGNKQRPYICPECGNWHLTTIKDKKGRKRAYIPDSVNKLINDIYNYYHERRKKK